MLLSILKRRSVLLDFRRTDLDLAQVLFLNQNHKGFNDVMMQFTSVRNSYFILNETL